LTVPGAHRKRTSVIAALSLSPVTHQPGLYFQSLVNDYYNNVATSAFVRDLLRHLRGPVILVWDNGNNHKGPPIQSLLADFPRLTIERLPPYAPDLNPVEQLWQHLKVGHLANYAAPNIQTLDDKALDYLSAAKSDRDQLRSCFKNTPLYNALTGHQLSGSQ
jgi:transposase